MTTHTINSDQTVAVAIDTYWLPVASCPPGVKVQLLSKGGVAVYGVNNGDSFWTHWCPLPKKPLRGDQHE
jgi:hypothetical protein